MAAAAKQTEPEPEPLTLEDVAEATPEHCPACRMGVLEVVTDWEKAYSVRCRYCNHTESRPKTGFTVKRPGEPLTEAPDEKTNGGES